MDFEIAGQQYRSGKMDAFRQFHVSRRIAPVLSGLAAGAAGLSGAEPDQEFAAFLQPLVTGIASMSDADCDYVLHACLGVVKRQQGNAWAPIFIAQGNSLMFDDIDLSVMLQIASRVIQDNLGNFIQDAVSKVQEAPQTA